MNNYFVFGSNVTAKADMALNNESAKKLWKSFCYGCSDIELVKGESNTFVLGDAEIPEIEDGKEYAISVTERGAAVSGADYGGLVRGFIALIMQIQYNSLEMGKEELKIACFNAQSDYRLRNRMIHICVFPEDSFYSIKKLIRFAGLCQYTHIVIEFWGMLKYDCLKELAWENAFTKEQAKELVRIAKEFGMEAIPMFNQLGHATASRVCYGKHVVLDQNPRLQDLFTPDGWAWDLTKPEVLSFLKDVRHELYELFPDTEYIHIGCDEAYYYSDCEELRKQLPELLGTLTEEIVKENRRPMLWMDMILEKEKFTGYEANGKAGECEAILNALPKESVFVDWQYDVKKAPIETLEYLNKFGYDTIGAPWLNRQNYDAHIETLTQNNMYGIMLTTWHTLHGENGMPAVLGCAEDLGAITLYWSKQTHTWGERNTETATLLRRISFEGNTYDDCGWKQKQVVV